MMEARLRDLADGYFAQYMGRIRSCAALLSDQQLWWRAHEGSNSVANLLLHLCGNLSQWVLAGLGGQAYERHRSREFSAREGAPAEVLVTQLEEVVRAVRQVVAGLSAADLQARRHVQGYDTDGLGVLLHAVEHMSYHTGQIVMAAKQLRPEAAIEFYPQHRGE